jgi:Protein of unknown function (DUF2865)
MSRRSVRQAALGVAAASCLLASVPVAHAEDFLSALFGAFGGGRPQAPAEAPPPYAGEGSPLAPRSEVQRPRISTYGGSQAFCVRSCDGRYFPASGSDHQSRAASCNGLCPAGKTVVVYGSDIDRAATESGKPYAELPNAFRYRNEIVAGCTCNGKDQFGLAPVKIENDPTLRKGDLIAGDSGLVAAAHGADKSAASLNFSPVSKPVLARYQRVPVVAAE